MRSLCLLTLCVFLLTGCGGSGNSFLIPLPGFYRGNVTVQNLQHLNGTGSLVIEVISANSFRGYGDVNGRPFEIVKGETKDLLSVDGQIVVAAITTRRVPNGFAFSFAFGTIVYATGTVTKENLPSLGEFIGRPPPGEYQGDVVVIGIGRVQGFGLATASIDSDFRLTCNARVDSGWLGTSLFLGMFEPDGTMSEAVILSGGQALFQLSSPRYSWDGSKLVVRFDELHLKPGSAWLTLRPVP